MERGAVVDGGEPPVVLSIGTTHPWNIAGVGLDLRVGGDLGVSVVTVVAGVSAQDDRGVHAVHPIPAETLRAQFEAVPVGLLSAIRVGALPSAAAVIEVARVVNGLASIPAVVDPVIAASRGGVLADEATVDAIRERLATLPNVVLTPNVPEAAQLLGFADLPLDSIPDAAIALRRRGARAVLLKGGHLQGEPVDTLATEDGLVSFRGGRLPNDMRGTGCVLAMALACNLARGKPLIGAVETARQFVRSKILSAKTLHGLRVAY